MLFSFGRDVNINWKHGINALEESAKDGKGRISIVLWGLVLNTVEEEGSPPMVNNRDNHGGYDHSRGHRDGGRRDPYPSDADRDRDRYRDTPRDSYHRDPPRDYYPRDAYPRDAFPRDRDSRDFHREPYSRDSRDPYPRDPPRHHHAGEGMRDYPRGERDRSRDRPNNR